MARPPDLKVAFQKDDGTFEFISPEELQERQRRRIVHGWEWLAIQYKMRGKVTHRAVLETLAGFKFTGKPIPPELIDPIASTIAGKVAWQRAQARQRSNTSEANLTEILNIAGRMGKEHPSLKIPKLARQALRVFKETHPEEKLVPPLRAIVAGLKNR
jgi:hypothetical protein